MLECLEKRELMAANVVLVRPVTTNLTLNTALLQATVQSLQIGSPLENGRPQPANGPVIASQTPLEKPYKPVTDVLRVPAGVSLDSNGRLLSAANSLLGRLPAGMSLDSNKSTPGNEFTGPLKMDSFGRNLPITANSPPTGRFIAPTRQDITDHMWAMADDMKAKEGNNTTRTEQQSGGWAEFGKALLAGAVALGVAKADAATKPENAEQEALNIELTKLQIEKSILEIEKLEREAQEADDTKQGKRPTIYLNPIYINGRNGTPDPNREFVSPTPEQLAAMEARIAQRKEKMIGQPDENKRPHQKPIMNAARPGSPGLGNLINPGSEGGSVATGAATVRTGAVENKAKKLLVGPSNPDEPTGNGSGRPTPPRPTQSGDSGAPKK